MKRKRFDDRVLAEIAKSLILRIRAGDDHRFIGIWAVVFQRRVFVRSWTLNERSWYRTFLEERAGAVQIGAREIPVRSVHIRSERVKDGVDRAYAEKYKTPASRKYVRGFRVPKRRDTTTELLPR